MTQVQRDSFFTACHQARCRGGAGAGEAPARAALRARAPAPPRAARARARMADAADAAGPAERAAEAPEEDAAGEQAGAAGAGGGEGAAAAAAGGQTAEELERIRVRCWACTCLIQLPSESVPEGKTAGEIYFTCGGCGANNLPGSVAILQPPDPKWWQVLLKKAVGNFLFVFVPSLVVYIGAGAESFGRRALLERAQAQDPMDLVQQRS
ncbi:unnamed protein product [Prorocentrum cordatum]|uniref:Uncharacterized protein n=1 Tax=Prorocentrum cordatum TaxID=2364126 RepID=A0ABN9WBT0_9DINO|nr:unnamed protein product [Polarella glacialis]